MANIRKINNELKSYINEASFVSNKCRNKLLKMLGETFDVELPLENFAKIDAEIKDIQATTTVSITGESAPVTIEEAERIIKDRETNLKDTQEQRSLNRGLARDQRYFGGSGK